MPKSIQMSEDMHERKLAAYCRERGYVQHHVPNEGKRPDPRTMPRLKALGFTPGFPDHIICSRYAGVLFIEMKKPGEEPSTEQMTWLAALTASGAKAVWCDSADDAIEWIEEQEKEAQETNK